MLWMMGNVKLLLEWFTVPLFIIAVQLPQGAALYWLVSSLTALAQVLLTLPPIHETASFSLYTLSGKMTPAEPRGAVAVARLRAGWHRSENQSRPPVRNCMHGNTPFLLRGMA